MTFNVGDVVRLKSGGARMTVASTGSGRHVIRCVWHNANEKGGFDLVQSTFPAETLVLDSVVQAMVFESLERLSHH